MDFRPENLRGSQKIAFKKLNYEPEEKRVYDTSKILNENFHYNDKYDGKDYNKLPRYRPRRKILHFHNFMPYALSIIFT